ncbi:YwmB family TATA-box binding protein [Mesobacillus foraminis]|uniref:YwmB family TATA-box binding protein n=1 Tax=Mesobacillus foraminis TaxID=279826 RepID=UPI001BE91506|nr:YwmB family TATA-box binding protein [Mesobacillus foraminis]MBT2758005.1 YwmB family TATA-box binding protein [Mesobacillus foraminis]
MYQKFIYTILLVAIISVSNILHTGASQHIDTKNELLQMTDVANEQGIKIKSWSMYVKQPMTEYQKVKDVKKRIEEIKEEYNEFSWSKQENKGDNYIITGKRNLPSLNVKEKILLIYLPSGNQYKLSVNYDVKGVGWDSKDFEGILKRYQTEIKQFSVFYTIKGHTGLKSNLEKETNNLLKEFSGQAIEHINEPDFMSVSASTGRWENNIPLEDEKFMNLHIAYRNSNNGLTTVTIGTPIITSEY